MMSTAELKLALINKITELKEVRIIEELKKILDFELDNGDFILSSSQKNRLIEAQNDDIISDDQANQEIEKWLSEQ